MDRPVFTNRQVARRARLRLAILELHPEFMEKFREYMITSAMATAQRRAVASKDFRTKAQHTAEKLAEVKFYLEELADEHRALLEQQAEQFPPKS
jgi:hypothetical protein